MRLLIFIASIFMLVKGFSSTDIVSSDDNWTIHKNSPFLSYSAEFGFKKNKP